MAVMVGGECVSDSGARGPGAQRLITARAMARWSALCSAIISSNFGQRRTSTGQCKEVASGWHEARTCHGATQFYFLKSFDKWGAKKADPRSQQRMQTFIPAQQSRRCRGGIAPCAPCGIRKIGSWTHGTSTQDGRPRQARRARCGGS